MRPIRMNATIMEEDSKYSLGSSPREVHTAGKTRLNRLKRNEMTMERATRVSMPELPCAACFHAVLINLRPHQKTAGAAKAQSTHPFPGKGLNPIPTTMIRTDNTAESRASLLRPRKSSCRSRSASASAGSPSSESSPSTRRSYPASWTAFFRPSGVTTAGSKSTCAELEARLTLASMTPFCSFNVFWTRATQAAQPMPLTGKLRLATGIYIFTLKNTHRISVRPVFFHGCGTGSDHLDEMLLDCLSLGV